MKKTLLIVILIGGLVQFGFSQIHQDGAPVAEQYQFANKTSYVLLDQTVDEAFHPESEISGPTALYAGYILPFQKEDMENGNWESVKPGIHTWRIGIIRENAKALNVYFQDVVLRKEEQLFIYNQDRSVVLGAFTNINNGEYLATEFIFDNMIIIEFSTRNTERVIPFEIRGIGVSVMDNSSRNFGDADFCEVLMNCPEGDDWQNEKRGVVRILVTEASKLYWCSGVLVNNTSLDAAPYILTAKHCGENASSTDYANWVFNFLYESTDCVMPSFEPIHKSLSGSTYKASSISSSSFGSDFKLVLLHDDVPKAYEPYFNGWNRNGEGANSGVTIHHPEGDLKMISTYNVPLVSTNYPNPTPNPDGKYWLVTWAETESGYGVTEGGSSGAPIFDPGGYLVGQLSGGRASCTLLDEPDYYGKFSYSWSSSGSDSSRQLKLWLDPIDSGVEVLKGVDFYASNVQADFYSNKRQIKVGESVEFINSSEGTITQYEWRFPGGEPTSSEAENPPNIQYNSSGKFDVGLYVSSAEGNDSLIKREYIHVLPTMFPNPSDGRFIVRFGARVPDDIDVMVSDALGKQVDFILIPSGEMTLTIDLSQNMAGLYLVKIKTNSQTEILKAILYNR